MNLVGTNVLTTQNTQHMMRYPVQAAFAFCSPCGPCRRVFKGKERQHYESLQFLLFRHTMEALNRERQ